MGYRIPVDDSNIRPYLHREVYRTHWVYGAFPLGGHLFLPTPDALIPQVAEVYGELARQCADFTFRSESLIEAIFPEELRALPHRGAVLPAVGFPPAVGAFATLHDDVGYAVIDLPNVVQRRSEPGKSARRVLHDLITHEVVHLLIGMKHPPADLPYHDYLDLMAFHEGFAHLLSYRDDIAAYRPVAAVYRPRFEAAQKRLREAVEESNPHRRAQFAKEAIGGPYWEKFAAVAAMLYLMRRVDRLPEIYSRGWRGFCEQILHDSW